MGSFIRHSLQIVLFLLFYILDHADTVRYVRYTRYSGVRYVRYTRYTYTYTYTYYGTSYASGRIAGVIVGAVFSLIAVIAVLVVCFIICRRRRRTSSGRVITPYNANPVYRASPVAVTTISGPAAQVPPGGFVNPAFGNDPNVDGTTATPANGTSMYPAVAPPSYDASMAAQTGAAASAPETSNPT